MAKENLFALKRLVQELEDRDSNLKRDYSLFESAFHNFPIPVTIWSSDNRGLCETRHVTDAPSPGWSGETDSTGHVVSIYKCQSLREQLQDKIREVLSSGPQSFVCEGDRSCIWTRLQPRVAPDGCVVGVIGISMDVTSSFGLLNQIRSSQLPPPLREESDNVKR